MRSKKVCFSLEFIQAGRVGGAEQFAIDLLKGIADCHYKNFELSVLHTGLPGIDSRLSSIVVRDLVNSRFLRETMNFHRFRGSFDLIIYPNYFRPVGFARGTRVITVIHDLQYKSLPHFTPFVKRVWLRLAHEYAWVGSDVIAVVSEFVKNDILRKYGRHWEPKIEVIGSPIDWSVLGMASTTQSNRDRPYILCLTAQWPHKNLHTLIRAFAKVRESERELSLVIAGQNAANLKSRQKRGADLCRLVNDLGLRDGVVFMGYVSDRRRAELLQKCLAFVFPSLFEGFGRPAVEALGVGIPVITNSWTSLGEVTKGYATYVSDPGSVNELSEVIIAVVRNPGTFRPTAQQITEIRQTYDHRKVGAQFCYLVDSVLEKGR